MKWFKLILFVFAAQFVCQTASALDHKHPAVELYPWRNLAGEGEEENWGWSGYGNKHICPAWDFTCDMLLDNGETITIRYCINDEDPTTVKPVTGGAHGVDDEGNPSNGYIVSWRNCFSSNELGEDGKPLEANRMTLEQTGLAGAHKNTNVFNTLTIPETVTDAETGKTYAVTKIGILAFSENMFAPTRQYEKLVLPKTIVSIEYRAFYTVGLLKEIDISQCTALQTIGKCAFNYNTALQTIDFSNCTALQTIGWQAFRYCEALTSVDLSACKNLTTFGNGAFANCTSLTKAILPPSVTTTNGGLFANCSSLKEVYITSKLTEVNNSYTNFNNTPADCAIYLPLQHMTYYRTPANFYAGNSGQHASKFYPILEAGKMYRTFSFDKALNFDEIKGLYDETKTLKANYVSAVDVDNRRVTFKAATGDFAAYEGFIIEGTGVDGEFYPVKKATTTPAALAEDANYLEGNGEKSLSFEDKKPADNKQRYFIMKGGDFYYCTGGTLAPWKCYLDLRTPISIYNNGVSGETKPFTFVYEEDTFTPQPVVDGLQEVKDEATVQRVYYTLDGVRLSGQPTQKGIYICNGRKVVVR